MLDRIFLSNSYSYRKKKCAAVIVFIAIYLLIPTIVTLNVTGVVYTPVNEDYSDGRKVIVKYRNATQEVGVVLLGAVGGNVGNSRWYDVAPDLRPEATVTKRIGNIVPSFALLNPVYTGRFIDGWATTRPSAAPTIIAININVVI